MAFLPDEQNAQNQNAPVNGNPMASQAPITSSPAPAAGGSSGKTINQATNQGPAQPFTNLQAYLSANAPQIQAQGAQIAGGLNTQYGATTGAIDSASKTFGDNVKSGYTPNDAQVVNNFSADPSKVAADPDAAKTFTGMYNDRYTGPSSFESTDQYGAVNDQVQKGQQAAQQVSTLPGIQSYLMGQNPSETQGMATLDASLLNGNPDAVGAIQTAAQQFQALPSYLTNAVNANDALVTKGMSEADAAKAAAQGAASKYATDFSGRLNSAYTGATKQSVDYNNLVNDLNTKMQAGDFASLTPEEVKLTGYNPTDTQLFKDYPTILPTQAQNHPIDFGSYFTPGDNAKAPTPANVVSDGDISNYKALQMLTGNAPNLNFDMPAAHQDGTSASGLPGKLPSYDNEQALQAINSAYGPLFQEGQAAGVMPKNIQDYMASLMTALRQPQPAPLPTVAQPAPGTNGDLGAGFHWDQGTGAWVPTIPLRPGGDVSGGTIQQSGGGRATF